MNTCDSCRWWSTQVLDDGTMSNYGTFVAKDGTKREKNWCSKKKDATMEYATCDKWEEKIGNQKTLF